MRSWDKYCEDTEKAFKHFRDCIWQPVYITGYLGTKHSYLFQVDYRLHPFWDKWVTLEVHPSGEMAPNDLNMSDVNKSGEVNVSITIDHLDKLFI